MKLWEALKALDENPKKIFKSNEGFGEVTLEYRNGIKFIGIQKTINGAFLSELRYWQEVKQPVPWQEAIEAWANGKRIKYENEHGCLTYSGNTLKDELGPLASYQLTTGTWYIED